jgi:hypothetical protein
MVCKCFFVLLGLAVYAVHTAITRPARAKEEGSTYTPYLIISILSVYFFDNLMNNIIFAITKCPLGICFSMDLVSIVLKTSVLDNGHIHFHLLSYSPVVDIGKQNINVAAVGVEINVAAVGVEGVLAAVQYETGPLAQEELCFSWKRTISNQGCF